MQNVFEFDDLDQLYERVQTLCYGDVLAARHERRTALAVVDDISNDERFEPFECNTAQVYRQGEKPDWTVFHISRRSSQPSR